MAASLPSGSLNLETQLLSVMDVLVKAAVAEISQLFSESSAELRLHLTQSLRENDSLRMRLKLMRSELFSLKLQTRATRPSSRCALRASTPKPRAKAQANQVSESVNPDDQTTPPHAEKITKVEGPDVILIKDEDESEGCSVDGHHSYNSGVGVDPQMEMQQTADIQVEVPLLNQEDMFFNMSGFPAFTSVSPVPTTSHDLTLPPTNSDPVRMVHNDIIVGMAINNQLERTPIIQSVSTSMPAPLNQNIDSGSEDESSTQLQNQDMSVPTPKPLYCNVCRERFNSRSELNAHRASHTGDSPVSCPMCGKLFVSKNTLGIHMRIHTGEKPYVCLLCGKRFTQNGGLRIHLRTHSGEKPYTCVVCQTSFNNPSNLRRHMVTHKNVV